LKPEFRTEAARREDSLHGSMARHRVSYFCLYKYTTDSEAPLKTVVPQF
jgi:hypothetical protein